MQNDGSVSPVKAFFRNKWVRLILIVDVIAIIAVIGIVINNNTKTATLNISVAPVDAEVILNGKGGYGNGSYNLHPGIYEVEVKRDTLESKYFTLELKSGYNTTFTTFLKGENNNFDFYTFRANYDSLQKLIQIASATDNLTIDQDASAEEFIKGFQRAMSILEILPIKGYVYAEPSVNASTAGFAIKSGEGKENCEKTACLLVNYYGKDYESAVMKKIEEAGYKPTDYQIIYERY